MKTGEALGVSQYDPSVLLGRSLNDIEKKFAPRLLYVAGPMRIPLPRPRVALIGSREASAQGVKDAESIVRILVEKGAVIVSGLAKGIDTAAHKAAISRGGQTIAVIGTPLDRAYPAQNSLLQELMSREHLVISQFKVGTDVIRANFIQRNRTMALISDASIIVQAGESSGSLSQGWETLRLGRPLFIWKSIFESSLRWPANMVSYGAMKLSNPTDIIEHLPSTESILKINV